MADNLASANFEIDFALATKVPVADNLDSSILIQLRFCLFSTFSASLSSLSQSLFKPYLRFNCPPPSSSLFEVSS